MAHGATTIHRFYAIRVGQTGDDPLPTDSQRFSKLCERLTTELGLIIFDEFSMIQRRMIRWVVHRLGEAGVNMDHIGVLFVGDPAQILPIGDAPVWSLRQRSDDGKECSEASILGMAAFRELFRMPALDTLPGYETWRSSLGKNPADLSDSVRAEVARFRASAYDGDFETVYLNEVRRTVENDEFATQFTGDVLPSMRYGKATPEKIQWLRDNCATERDMSDDPVWKMAVKLHGYHWFSEWASFRETVESDNAKALVNFAEDRGAHVMAVNSQHLPATKAGKLQGVSAKEFRGVSSAFRELFRMPALDTLPGYETWRSSLGKNPADLSDSVRAEVARFRASAYDGDFETVYLNEVRRTVENDEFATQFTGDVLPSMRYGKATPEKIQWLRDNCATERDMSDDPVWKMAVKLHGYHWFSEWASFRETVESDNAKALVNFAEDRGAHVMAVNSQHLPATKAGKLQGVSAKEFRGVSSAFRELFRMPALDTLPGYETWRSSLGKNPADLSDSVRAEVARFRASAYDGDFETVYLNEVRRTVENDEVATQFTGDVLPSMRYGKATAIKNSVAQRQLCHRERHVGRSGLEDGRQIAWLSLV